MIEHPINSWLSAALDDPKSCDQFKKDIVSWLDICNNNVIVPTQEYHKLLDKEWFLMCLIEAGVYNWDGFGDAADSYEEGINE